MTHQWFWVCLSVLIVAWAILSRLGKVSRGKAHEIVESGGLLVDVRTEEEYGGGHLENALNVPLQSLRQKAPELVEQHKPIVVYCRSGMRSGAARRLLREAGAAQVYDLGAMSRW